MSNRKGGAMSAVDGKDAGTPEQHKTQKTAGVRAPGGTHASESVSEHVGESFDDNAGENLGDTVNENVGESHGAKADQPALPRRAASSIQLKGLHKRFGNEVAALDGVDLSIEPGEFFTLLGPSGCGKTTLLRILAGLEALDEGQVVIGGRDVTEVPPHQRSVNTVFQSYALFPHLSVRDNLAFGLKMRGVAPREREARVAEMAEFIKLGSLIDRRVDQLSGGQRQRIALARALVCEPDVLLLDEPLSALDAGLRSQIQIELLRLQKRLGMTFVFVTHDQQEAMVMSDRIAVLDSGSLQQVGSPREIYERPANAFVARFMGHANLFDVTARDDSRSDAIRLTTPLGVLTAQAPGTGSLLLLRPETLDLRRRPASEFERHDVLENHLPGRVQERLYRGSHAEYRVEVAGVSVQVVVNNRGGQLPEVGDQVDVVVAAQDLITLGE
ncbi:ABC transporter ATP-binding protein [Cobetia amphilecti]|uniref:Spermidine/putrescine import ATP-binding protein PotA n=1 Tax=Cobetia amphilecti TaxID=1055104 RepID=A0AAP4U0C1_9GAMM|nr:ABC transporter ATP-binding protein [Cobetia amphilecti]MDO6672732.1 ABC transporter ATP-binding protein [Cobetia amphilecti]